MEVIIFLGFVVDDGKHWNAFVHDWSTLPRFKHLFIRGKAKNHVFGSRDLSFSVVALRLNFKRPRTQSFSGFCTVDGGSCAQCYNCYGLWNPYLRIFFFILLSVVYMKTFVSQIMAFVFLVFSSISLFIEDLVRCLIK